MKSDLNKLTKIEREDYTRTNMILDRVCENISGARPGSYFILAHNCDPKYKATIKYFIVSSKLSMIEIKLHALSELGLSSDTPANLTYKGRKIPENYVPMSDINFGMIEKDFIHLYIGAHLPGGMMQGFFSKIFCRCR